MEVYSSVQSHLKMDTNNSRWECYEDDLSYAELRRQVLLLTAEDDEDLLQNNLPNPATPLQQRLNASPTSTLQHGCYYDWSGSEANQVVPPWLFSLWKSGNGTGVFIPQIVKPRRRYKPRRKNNEKGSMYKLVANVQS